MPRRSKTYALAPAPTERWLSWLLAVCLTCVGIGVQGALGHSLVQVELKHYEEESFENLPVLEAMLAAPAEESPAADPAEAEPEPDPVEQVPAEAQPEELPEPVAALTEADVFTVPPVMAEVQPAQILTPRQKPAAIPQPSAKPRPTAARTSSTGTARASTAVSTNIAARGGRMPNPSYPSFAKSSRMQGSVKLLIRVSATGGIDSTTVIGTSGFSALDDYVANAVRRSWRLNPGPAGSYTKTFTFQLR